MRLPIPPSVHYSNIKLFTIFECTNSVTMRETSLPFRTALVQHLNPITYMGQIIPICDEYRNTAAAILPIGNNKPVKAWIQLTNQTSDDNSPKCHRNDLASIQIQVRVAFNANSGNYEDAEKIADLILAKLFPDQNEFTIEIDEPFHIWNLRFESSRNLNFSDDTDRVWMKNILLTAQIEQ